MNARRALTAFAVASVALALLAACAPSAETDASSGAASGTDAPATTTGPELSGELTIFAAASLGGPFDELATRFEARNPSLDVLPVTYDGSSVLATQLVEGAPADVFASADEPNLDRVAEEGLVAGEPEVFATNVLEIAVQPGNPLSIDGLDALSIGADPAPVVVVCAAEVPCGRAAATLLDDAGVELSPASEEQNVSAVLTKVRTGEADAGLVYVTDVRAADGEVEGIEIDGADAATNRYPIAALAGAANPAAAAAFVEFVRSSEGAEVLAEFGFGSP
ncbi:molybdate ABC transporter substrate-binding protein [Agromyces lapidis]|uniref:Molybdate ABC transporter substrate-binding protein n=1 Tax=Agromyces lapidis TaxID=279574 RepID=A0ABV5SRT7_9MICO|nr:molybdate ABC transporter substrate-binding protein [Agromyces lapidis]